MGLYFPVFNLLSKVNHLKNNKNIKDVALSALLL